MNRKLFRLLSIFAILLMSVSFVEGGKRFFIIKKEYGQESANDLRSILGLSVFRDCRKYFKIKGNSGEVCLNTNSILDKSEFLIYNIVT